MTQPKKPMPLWLIWLIAAATCFAIAAVNGCDDAPPVPRHLGRSV